VEALGNEAKWGALFMLPMSIGYCGSQQ
jgi:hypothetical protein